MSRQISTNSHALREKRPLTCVRFFGKLVRVRETGQPVDAIAEGVDGGLGVEVA